MSEEAPESTADDQPDAGPESQPTGVWSPVMPTDVLFEGSRPPDGLELRGDA